MHKGSLETIRKLYKIYKWPEAISDLKSKCEVTWREPMFLMKADVLLFSPMLPKSEQFSAVPKHNFANVS